MLKCTKFDFGWGSAPDPAGGAYSAPPDLVAGFKGAYSKGREGKGGREGKEGIRKKERGGRKGKGGVETEGQGWEGKFRGQVGKGRERCREKGRGGKI